MVGRGQGRVKLFRTEGVWGKRGSRYGVEREAKRLSIHRENVAADTQSLGLLFIYKY